MGDLWADSKRLVWRAGAVALVVALIAIMLKCEPDRPYVGMQAVESGRGVAEGEITLGEYVVLAGVTACVSGKKHCYYGAVSSGHPAAQAQATAEDDVEVDDALERKGVSLLVRSDTAFATMLQMEHGASDGKLVRVSDLPLGDQSAIKELELRNTSSLHVFLPESSDTVLGGLIRSSGGRKFLFTIALIVLLGVVTLIQVILWIGKKTARPPVAAPAAGSAYSAPPAPEFSAPPPPSTPYVPVSQPSPGPESLGPESLQGTRVIVERSRGEPLTATVESVRPGQYLCRFESGQKAWVVAESVRPLSARPPPG